MVKIKTLDCGVTVVLDHLADFNSAAVGIWVRTGAVNEEKRISGISHLIEHMMFKGTEKRNALQIAEDVDKIGGQINAFTGKEATCYYIKTLSDNLDTSLEILLDMFTGSVFDKTELEREKLVVLEEKKAELQKELEEYHIYQVSLKETLDHLSEEGGAKFTWQITLS